jgi:DNA-binding transcriptional LysR family regulator
MAAVASPDYLAHRGVPHTPVDLHSHACINWRLQAEGRAYRWEFEKRAKRMEVAVEGPLITHHSDIGVAAALQGLGIAYAYDRERIDEHLTRGRLVQVLADWSITRPGLFLDHPSRRHVPAALRAFIECLLDKDLPEDKRRPRASR